MMGFTPKKAYTVLDADLPVTGETSTEVPKASVYQVAEKAAEAAADKAQDAEFAKAARAKQRAPLEAKRKEVETQLKALQTRMNERRDTRGRASEIQLDLKANLRGQLEEIDEQLRAIGGRRKTRRRPTRSTRRR
jgi:translation initiation factor IF-2